MQPQDTQTAFLIKVWPWIEANRIRLAVGTGIIVVAVFFYSFFSYQREQKEIAAGEAYSRLALSSEAGPRQWADAYLKIANDYPDTLAGRRALLQGATALYVAGQYADAQAQFQKSFDAHSDGQFSASAALGVAASLDALGKLDPAASAYQRILNGFPSDMAAVNAAKFALARISVERGKFTDALNAYESIARSNPDNALRQEAAIRAMELKTKLAPAAPAVAKPGA